MYNRLERLAERTAKFFSNKGRIRRRKTIEAVVYSASVVAIISHLIAPGCTSLQIAIWSLFTLFKVATPCLYGHRSVRRVWYTHRAESIIAICQNPIAVTFEHIHSILGQMMTISVWMALVAHCFLFARLVRREWGHHPFFASALCLITTGVGIGQALQVVEPATFSNWGVTTWFELETVTTVGYGDVSPTTPLGQLMSLPLMALGGAVYGIFLQLIGQYALKMVHWQEPALRIRTERQRKQPDTEERLDLIEKRLAAIQGQLAALVGLVERQKNNTKP